MKANSWNLLLILLNDRDFQNTVASLPGYNIEQMGKVIL